MPSVFVIINESKPVGSDIVLTEVVPPARSSASDIMDDLRDIAHDSGVDIGPDDTSVYVPVKGTHLETDEYYIIELEVEDRG